MKKKLLATVTSVAALSTMLAVPAVAGLYSDGETAPVIGENYTVSPVIEVALPSDLTFGINPFSLDADDDPDTTADQTQIVATDYVFYNLSQVPVTVKTATKATATGSASITDSAYYNALSGEMTVSGDAAEVFLLQTLPTITAVDADGGGVLTNEAIEVDGKIITGQANAVSSAAYVLSTDANEITFKLDKLTGDVYTSHIGGFSFAGAVDPQATFSDGDVTVETVFTLDVISDAQFAKNYNDDARFEGDVNNIVVLTGESLAK